MKYTIDGILTTISPLHITSAVDSSSRYDPKTGRYVSTGGAPLTRTRTKPVFIQADYERTDENGESEATSVRLNLPIIPATTWRGMLRRGAAKVIEDRVRELGQKLTYGTYQGLHCGAISHRPDGVPPTTEEIINAKSHVFYGLFGGGPRMLRGNLKVSDSMPVIVQLIESGILPEHLFDSALKGRSSGMLTIEPVIRKDDFIGVSSDDNTGSVVGNFEEIYSSKRDEALDREKSKRLKGADSNGTAEVEDRGLNAYSFREDVTVGVPFYFHVTIDGTPAQVGMIINAIKKQLALGIGGRSALGFGRVSGTLRIKSGQDNYSDLLLIKDNECEELDPAMPFLDACAEAVGILTMVEINRYMVPEFTDEEKREKAAKNGK